MTDKFIHHLASSMFEVCGMMLGTTVGDALPVAGRPAMRGKSVSAVIPLTGALTGCAALRMSVSTAEPLASALAGQKLAADTPDFADALGEIANMVVGGAKARLSRSDVSIGTPSVVSKVDWPRDTARRAIGFGTPFGKVYIEVAVRDGTATHSRAAA